MDSFIKWYGGKSLSRDEIISMIPAHKTYVEAFTGASWILFDKPPSPVEIINDVDNELVNLYLVIQNNLEEFIEYMNRIPISEYLFNVWKSEKVYQSSRKGIPNVDLASRTYFILMNAFNGNIGDKPSFATSPNKQSGSTKFHRTDWNRIRDRLKEVTILNQDFRAVIKKLDSSESFFYLDPPYTCTINSRRYYRYTLSGPDHEDLAESLSVLKGKFILSYDDVPEIHKRYSNFNIMKLSNGDLAICNYKPAEKPFYCREGIPDRPGNIKRSAWFISNCPVCDSREVQKLYVRKTLPNKSRTFEPNGYTCRNCGSVFK